jgi:hexokinase
LVTALSLHEILQNHFKEYECTVCALELTNDEKGNKTYLTPELKEINDTLKFL